MFVAPSMSPRALKKWSSLAPAKRGGVLPPGQQADFFSRKRSLQTIPPAGKTHAGIEHGNPPFSFTPSIITAEITTCVPRQWGLIMAVMVWFCENHSEYAARSCRGTFRCR